MFVYLGNSYWICSQSFTGADSELQDCVILETSTNQLYNLPCVHTLKLQSNHSFHASVIVSFELRFNVLNYCLGLILLQVWSDRFFTSPCATFSSYVI